MIEDSTSEDIDHVPELQELLQDREPTTELHNEPELSLDEEPEFVLEVSIVMRKSINRHITSNAKQRNSKSNTE